MNQYTNCNQKFDTKRIVAHSGSH